MIHLYKSKLALVLILCFGLCLPLAQGQDFRIESQQKSRSARPTPKPPLYKAYPASQVVVCEVGDKYVMTRAQLESRISDVIELNEPLLESDNQYDRQIAADRLAKAETEAMNEWAITKSLALLARRDKLTVSAAEVSEQIRQINKEISSNDNDENQSAGRLLGISESQLRDEVEDSMLVERYFRQEVEKNFTEEQLKKIYRDNPSQFIIPPKYHVYQIVRTIDPQLSPEEVKDMRSEFYKVRKQAARRGGRDFEKLAREHSDSETGRESGGDIGWVDRNTPLPDEVFEVIKDMRVGEVSQIIQTEAKMPDSGIFAMGQNARLQKIVPGAMYILMLKDKQSAQGTQYDETARERVINMLIQRGREQLGREFLRELPFSVRMKASGIRLIHEAQ
ncbi:MAG: peptidylprolyl isomerase [Candidatus Sumerlaeia bacterium]